MSKLTNKFGSKKVFDIDTKDWFYTSLADLYALNGTDYVYPLYGMFINTKSNFGESPVLISDNVLVNVPKHTLNTVREILQDNECVEEIKQGLIGFSIYQYQDKTYHKTCYSFNFVDLK